MSASAFATVADKSLTLRTFVDEFPAGLSARSLQEFDDWSIKATRVFGQELIAACCLV